MVNCGEKWVISMFMGEFNHTVDAKGRVIIPSKFRELLGDEFVITKGFDNILRRMIVGSAGMLETDKQGRILLPAPLRSYAKIEKDAVVIGNIDHIEVWSKDAWEQTLDIDSDMAAEKLYNSGITL